MTSKMPSVVSCLGHSLLAALARTCVTYIFLPQYTRPHPFEKISCSNTFAQGVFDIEQNMFCADAYLPASDFVCWLQNSRCAGVLGAPLLGRLFHVMKASD